MGSVGRSSCTLLRVFSTRSSGINAKEQKTMSSLSFIEEVQETLGLYH